MQFLREKQRRKPKEIDATPRITRIWANFKDCSIIVDFLAIETVREEGSVRTREESRSKEISLNKVLKQTSDINNLSKKIIETSDMLTEKEEHLIRKLLKQIQSKMKNTQDALEISSLEDKPKITNMEVYLAAFYEENQDGWLSSAENLLLLAQNPSKLARIARYSDGSVFRILSRWLNEKHRNEKIVALYLMKFFLCFCYFEEFHEVIVKSRIGSIALKIVSKYENASSNHLVVSVEILFCLSEDESTLFLMQKKHIVQVVASLLKWTLVRSKIEDELVKSTGHFLQKLLCYFECKNDFISLPNARDIVCLLVSKTELSGGTRRILEKVAINSLMDKKFRNQKFLTSITQIEWINDLLRKNKCSRTTLKFLYLLLLSSDITNREKLIHQNNFLHFVGNVINNQSQTAYVAEIFEQIFCLYDNMNVSLVNQFIKQLAAALDKGQLYVLPFILALGVEVQSATQRCKGMDGEIKIDSMQEKIMDVNRSCVNILLPSVFNVAEKIETPHFVKILLFLGTQRVEVDQLNFSEANGLFDRLIEVISGEALDSIAILGAILFLQRVMNTSYVEYRKVNHILNLLLLRMTHDADKSVLAQFLFLFFLYFRNCGELHDKQTQILTDVVKFATEIALQSEKDSAVKLMGEALLNLACEITPHLPDSNNEMIALRFEYWCGEYLFILKQTKQSPSRFSCSSGSVLSPISIS